MSRQLSGRKKILPGTASEMMLANRPRPVEPEPSGLPTLGGRAYVTPYEKAEHELYKKSNKTAASDQNAPSHCSLSEVDTMTVGTVMTTVTCEESSAIYKRYDFSQYNSKELLLVLNKKQEILDAIDTNRIVVIKGATGCGKTTQVPQFILDAAKENDVHCSIVVTQPRRIAAISVANRVSQERGWPVGTLVGYQIGLDKKGGDDTRILYVTTGVLLQKLIKNKDMKEFTHYIIDEIHERDQDMDFLLIVVRNFLNTRSPDARLIVMSATMDTSKFYDYLVTYYNEKLFKPHVIDIDEPSPYRIHNFFLDDLCVGKNRIVEAATLLPFEETPNIHTNAYKTAARIIHGLDQVDRADSSRKGSNHVTAVLVFLPGLHEIEEMEKTLREMSTPEQFKTFAIKPLHSSITANEQQAVFETVISKRKIILSTNIAESSVTVPDIGYVIDFCLTKCLVTDPVTGCTSLELMWASKSNLTQRAGRVGRIAEGRVFKMIPKHFYEFFIEQDAVPEMLRCPLESLVLKAKLLDMGPPKKILALALDQPDLMNIHQAVANLKEIGALLVYTENHEYDPSDGKITFMGTVMAHLPLDVRLGKLIFLGNVLDVTEECIVMACSMATKNMFSTPYGKHLEAYDAKLEWADSSCSDCIAFLNAYKTWRKITTGGESFKRLRQFADDNFLQLKAIREISQLEDDIKLRLKSMQLYKFDKFRPFQQPRREMKDVQNTEKLRPFYLKLAIAGAFFPNYFIRGSQSGQIDEKEALKVLGGNDPFSSVFLQGLPSNQPTQIYQRSIKEYFDKIAARLEVNVDNTSKAYVTFRRSLTVNQDKVIPGKIEMAVYRAIKMRQAGVKFSIPRLKIEEATKVYENHKTQNEIGNSELQKKMDMLIWPWRKVQKDDRIKYASELLEVRISHVETPHKFWVQSSLKLMISLMNNMLRALNAVNTLIRLPSDADLAVGSIYAAQLVDESTVFHRCRIIAKKKKQNKIPKEFEYTVYFIDHGSFQEALPADDIYDIPATVREEYCIDKLPDLAQECSLVKLRPVGEGSDSALSKTVWNKKACSILKSIAHYPTVAKIYSVVNDVLRIKLVLPNEKDEKYDFEYTVNYKLIQDKYAEKTDEDCSSLFYHEEIKRYKKCVKEYVQKDEKCGEYPDQMKQPKYEVSFDNVKLTENPESKTNIFLKGPFSPLEMKLFSLTSATVGKLVKIDRESVNSVLLDSDPSDPSERMVVAGFVGLNPKGDALNLRHTTIMPNVPALPTLCCLIFSPMIELRCNPSLTQYCGAICGLGYDKRTKQSYFPANDIEIAFDYEINDEILESINRIRFRLNMAISEFRDDLNETRQRLRNLLLKIFCGTKYNLQQIHITPNKYKWGLIEYDKLRDPQPIHGVNRHPTDDEGTVHQLIWAIRRPGDEEKEKAAVRENLSMLKSFAAGILPQEKMDCKLCAVILENPSIASLHLKLAAHRVRVKRYKKITDGSTEQEQSPSSSTNN